MWKYLLAISAVACLSSCLRNKNDLGVVDAYKPVYGDMNLLKLVSQQAAAPIVNGGKIAKAGSYLYQVEEGKGIHIIDVSNPSAPQKKSFLNIPVCNEVTLKGSYLYTNNANDLVVLNVSDINNVTLSSRTANAFPSLEVYYPPQTGVYFECADPSKGVVIGWELSKVNNPKCSR